jgi:hypothetical protein
MPGHVLRPPSRAALHVPVFTHFPVARYIRNLVLLLLISEGLFDIGLLQNLQDCGSPPLAHRASTLTRPTSLRTSDRKSMLAYLGLPLDIFGKVGLPSIRILTSS